MKEKITSTESASTVCYETMEAHARQCIQRWLQDLLETEFLGRGISQRRGGLEEARGLPQWLRQAQAGGNDRGHDRGAPTAHQESGRAL